MSADVQQRSPLELHARTLAATALSEAGVDRTHAAMAYLTGHLIEKAEFYAAAWASADKGDAISMAKLTHVPPGD